MGEEAASFAPVWLLEVLIAVTAATGHPKDREWLAQLGHVHDRGKAP